jgi:hypothetical protein
MLKKIIAPGFSLPKDFTRGKAGAFAGWAVVSQDGIKVIQLRLPLFCIPFAMHFLRIASFYK